MSRLRVALLIAALSGLGLPEAQARPVRPAEPEPEPEPEPELGGVFTVPVVAALDGVTPVVVVPRRRVVEASPVEVPCWAQKGRKFSRAERKQRRARGKL